MSMSSIKFGTSGLRGLAVELQGEMTQRYARGFIDYLAEQGWRGNGTVYLASDLRPSSPAILRDCAAAISAAGVTPVDCGAIPTPALALYAMAQQSPAIMITGSHIPADRNGLKFYSPTGEITKADEAGITAAADLVHGRAEPVGELALDHAARELYLARYTSPSPMAALAGLRIGVFEHSSIARDVLASALQRSGASIVRLGLRQDFVPVDTEAFGDAVLAPLSGWVSEHKLDAIVSTDADGDRPLLMDGAGRFVSGDVLGLLAAQFLGADAVVTPVTANSAIERTGLFSAVLRTRVGSPFVLEGMEEARRRGYQRIVGFEPNGGTLLGTRCVGTGFDLSALPTRDAILPLLAVLALAARQHLSVAELVAALPTRARLSDRLEHVPQSASAALLQRLEQEPDFAAAFLAPVGSIAELSTLDGVQFSFTDGNIVHFRASGNAPELRCYVEAADAPAATRLLSWSLEAARSVVQPN